MAQPQLEPGVQARVLEAATGLFARKGYHATSVREIVEAAGVTKPVLYYWFRSKEGVFQAIMQAAVEAHRATLAEVRASGGTAAERILQLTERVMALVLEHADVVRALDAVYYGPREDAPSIDFDSLYGEFDACLGEFLAEGVRGGEFRGDDIEAMHLALLGSFLICKASIHINEETARCGCEQPLDPLNVRRITAVVLDGMRTGKEEQR